MSAPDRSAKKIKTSLATREPSRHDVRHSSFGKTEIPLAGQSRFDGSQCTPTFQIVVRYKAAAASKEQTKAAKKRLTSLCPAEVASVKFQ
jgi:hypothetical protein